MTVSTTAEYSRVLALHGETMTLQRSGQTDTTIKGFMRSLRPDELVGELKQDDRRIITGSAELAEAVWPVPIHRGDKIVVRGHTYTVQSADGVASGSLVVRYNLLVRG
jgi:hypothetical protein